MMKSRSLSWISHHKRELEEENFLMEIESVTRPVMVTAHIFKHIVHGDITSD
jgi:hypothetical protein